MLTCASSLGLGHFLINGQKNKVDQGSHRPDSLPTLPLLPSRRPIDSAFLSIIDAYKTAEKLKAGKEIDENEYSFKPYFSIVKILHKDAIFVE